MRRVGLLVLVWSLLIVEVVAAAGTVKIDDPDNILGGRRGDVERAAQQLATKGADVVVMTVKNDGGNPQDQHTALPYLNDRLQRIGVSGAISPLNGTNNLPGNTILFFRATQSQHSAIYYVPRYQTKLEPALNDIFKSQMLPLFTKNDVAGGMVAGIGAVRSTLYPPPSPLTYGLIGLVVVGALALVLGPRLSKHRVAATALADARARVTSARNAAGATIADLGQLLRTAQEKAQYDKLSYNSADFHRITEFQGRGEQVFVEAQSIFDQAESNQNNADAKPTVAAYQQVIGEYEQSRALTQEATTAIQEAERLRAELDQANLQPRPSTGQTQPL